MAKGEMNHIEFPADDLERAKRFYSAVAGWEFGEMDGYPDYWLFRTSDGSGGGIGTRGESVGEAVRVYITVEDVDAAVEATKANGGTVIAEPSEVPGQGRYATVRDSEGSTIGLWETAAG
jgi:uncharacterized protein